MSSFARARAKVILKHLMNMIAGRWKDNPTEARDALYFFVAILAGDSVSGSHIVCVCVCVCICVYVYLIAGRWKDNPRARCIVAGDFVSDSRALSQFLGNFKKIARDVGVSSVLRCVHLSLL